MKRERKRDEEREEGREPTKCLSSILVLFFTFFLGTREEYQNSISDGGERRERENQKNQHQDVLRHTYTWDERETRTFGFRERREKELSVLDRERERVFIIFHLFTLS